MEYSISVNEKEAKNITLIQIPLTYDIPLSVGAYEQDDSSAMELIDVYSPKVLLDLYLLNKVLLMNVTQGI